MPARAVSTIQHCRRLGGSLRIAKLRGQRSGAAGGEQSKPTQRPLATCATAFISPCHPHPTPTPIGWTYLNWSQFLVRKLRKMVGFDSKTNPADPIEERSGEEIRVSLAVPAP